MDECTASTSRYGPPPSNLRLAHLERMQEHTQMYPPIPEPFANRLVIIIMITVLEILLIIEYK